MGETVSRINPLETCRPLGDRVVVRRDAGEASTPGGLLLPDMAVQKPCRATVVAVGPGRSRETLPVDPMHGYYFPMPVQVGDRVLIARFAGSDIADPFYEPAGQDDLLILRVDDILAVLDELPILTTAKT